MKNVITILILVLLVAGCRKKEPLPTYKIFERFTLYHGKEAIVVDTTVLPMTKYRIRFDGVLGDGRPNEECCSDCEPNQVVIQLTISNEVGEKHTEKAYWAGCVSGDGSPFGIWTTNIVSFGVVLKSMAVKPHPQEGKNILLNEYNVNLALWK